VLFPYGFGLLETKFQSELYFIKPISLLRRLRRREMRIYVIVALALFLVPIIKSFGEENNLNHTLGFRFGMSSKEALRVIGDKQLRVLENVVDSKKIRTIVVQGVPEPLPVDATGVDLTTRLEFWDKSLMSLSVIMDGGAQEDHERIGAELYDHLHGKYGEPSSRDSFMNFTTWTWQLPLVTLVLSSSPSRNMTKIEYTYKPIEQNRREKEVEGAITPEREDPVEKYFLK
jgi:hypothetical protein